MKSLFLLLALTGLSVQLPRPQLSPSLVSRGHTHSSYTSSLKRRSYQSSHRPRRRQTQGNASIISNEHLKFLAPITIGSQTLEAEIDTGSSDTWLIQTGFECFETFDASSQEFTGPESTSFCNFGPTYTVDAGYTPIPDLVELSCYGQSGENSERCVAGPFGMTAVTFCNLTISEQVIGAPDSSSFPAQGLAEQSGIIGMAFPALTSGINSTTQEPVLYSSIMNTFFEVDTFDPPLAKQFSLAISRDASNSGNGGILTIGGVPDLTDPTVNVSSTTFTSAAFQVYADISTTNYSFYSILIDGYVLGDSTIGDGTQIIIDSGANTVEAPQAIADSINSYWSPAGTVSGSDLILDCSAVLTEPFGIAIGGGTYYINSVDLIGQAPDGTCYSLVAAGPSGDYLVGDPLLRNTVAVYDWEDSIMSFYPRMYYES